VEDTYCLSAGRNAWSAKIAWADLAAALRLPDLHALEVVRRTASGLAWKLESNAGLVDAERLHLLLGRLKGWNLLRSRHYDVRVTETHAVFEGMGTGHGVGLCQIGAEQRGKAGQTWTQILQAYFPGTRAGVAAQDIPWRKLDAERVEMWTTGAPGDDRLPSLAEKALAAAEQKTSLRVAQKPLLKVYPSVAVFRDATGEPGTVAAVTRGRVIHLQPVAKLSAAGALESTVLHEMLHLVLGLNAKRPLPLWFEEGLADTLGDGRMHPAQRQRVEKMIRAKGLPAVLAMLGTGVRE
jgi:stage II sporulation protein D